AQGPLHPHHIDDRDALSDAYDERYFRLDSFGDGVGRPGWRHVDDARIAARFVARLRHGVENRQPQMDGSSLARRCPADHPRTVGYRSLRMKGAVLTGKALADDLGAAVDQNRHQVATLTAWPFFWAASSRSFAGVTLRLDVAMISFPLSTLVPSSRTTSGTRKPTSLTAATTPSAMTSHRMIPPKMLTRMPFTWGSEVMILNAAATLSLVALPPTSRKLAGDSPYSLIMSIVAMASPAPLTMQPMVPSSAT